MFVEEYKVNTFTILNKSKFIISDCITLFGVEKYRILFSFIVTSYDSLKNSWLNRIKHSLTHQEYSEGKWIVTYSNGKWWLKTCFILN